MNAYQNMVRALMAATAVAGWVVVASGQQPQSRSPLPLAPLGARGEAIYPAVEGWGPLKDGTNAIFLGYFNRNKDQEVDVPIGPNNRIEPGGPDYGQPTRFHLGRQHGVFAIAVPKDFGNKKLTWTLVVNGQTAVVQLSTNPAYWIDFYKHAANGNEPPVIRFLRDGPTMTGPPRGIAQTLSAVVNQPVTLRLWASDNPPTYDPTEGSAGGGRGAGDAGRGASAGRGATAAAGGRGAGDGGAPNFDLSAAVGRGGGRGGGGRGGGPPADVTVIWKKYRGPGEVKVADERIALMNKGDAKALMEATTTATFSVPGEYWMRAQVNDSSGDGGGGDQCCWTTAHVKVTVGPGVGGR